MITANIRHRYYEGSCNGAVPSSFAHPICVRQRTDSHTSAEYSSLKSATCLDGLTCRIERKRQPAIQVARKAGGVKSVKNEMRLK
jgi:hypothetical protein